MYSLVTLSADIQCHMQANLHCVRISYLVKKFLVLPYYGGGRVQGQYDELDGVLSVLALLFEDGDRLPYSRFNGIIWFYTDYLYLDQLFVL